MKLVTNLLQFLLPDYSRLGLRFLIGGLGLVACSWTGCIAKPAPVPAVQLSKPRDALLSYLSAVARCDVEAAKAASLGTEADKKWIVGMAALITGLRNYDQAMLARFGRQAIPLDIDLKQAVTTLVDQPIVRFQDGIVKEYEDAAEIDAAIGHIRLGAQPPVFLKRDKAGWKVDLTAMRQDLEHSPERIEQYLSAGRSLAKSAQDIRKGRYRTFDEAQAAIGDAASP